MKRSDTKLLQSIFYLIMILVIVLLVFNFLLLTDRFQHNALRNACIDTEEGNSCSYVLRGESYSGECQQRRNSALFCSQFRLEDND